jgi:hypothetical protein
VAAATRPRLRDRLAVAGFLLLFLVPMVARSTVHLAPLPGSPALLSKLHAIACLFTHKPDGWSSYYVQVRHSGRTHWETLDQAELFPLQPFGRRTRMHRLLAAWKAKPSAKTKDMARWIIERHAALHPDEPLPEAIRFGRAWVIPSRDAPPQRGWRHPTWLEIPPKRRRVIVVYLVDELLDEGAKGGEPQ